MSYKTGFYEGRLGIGLGSTMGMGDGNPRYPLDINGDIRLTGSIVNGDGQVLSLVPAESLWTIGTTDITYTGGNVGIGTTSPGANLEIKSSDSGNAYANIYGDNVSGEGMIRLSGYGGSSSYPMLYVGAGGGLASCFICSRYDHPLLFLQNNSEVMRIHDNGNVGIGTTNPGYKLEIKQGKVFLNNSNTWSDTDAANTKIYLGDTNFGVGSGHFTGDGAGEFTTLWSYNGAGRGIRFCSTALGTNKFSDYTTHMIIEGDTGNVGIGTTSPYTKLDFGDAGGDIRISQISGLAATGTITRYIGKYYTGNGGHPNTPWWCAIKFGGETTNGEDYISFITQQSGTPHDERMRITGTGNVGIGRTDPTYKLDVYNNGSARLGRFQTTGDVSIEISSTSPSSDYDDCGIVWHGHASAPWWHLGVTDNESRLCIGYQSNSSSTGWPDSSEKIYFASDGKVLAAGFTNYSDDRIKNNEKTVINALDVINKLQTKKYFKSTKMYSKGHNYILNDDGTPIKDESGNDITNEDYNIETGFIAQDVKKIPELAYSVFGEEMKYGKEYEIIYDESGNTIDDGTGRPKSKKVLGNYPKKLGVTYQDIFCYNVAATQELDRKVIALESENAELKAELAAIKQHLGI